MTNKLLFNETQVDYKLQKICQLVVSKIRKLTTVVTSHIIPRFQHQEVLGEGINNHLALIYLYNDHPFEPPIIAARRHATPMQRK
jgi:hypothetical protein